MLGIKEMEDCIKKMYTTFTMLKYARIKKNLTKQEVSVMLGISRSYLAALENASRPLTINSKAIDLDKLTKVLDKLEIDKKKFFTAQMYETLLITLPPPWKELLKNTLRKIVINAYTDHGYVDTEFIITKKMNLAEKYVKFDENAPLNHPREYLNLAFAVIQGIDINASEISVRYIGKSGEMEVYSQKVPGGSSYAG